MPHIEHACSKFRRINIIINFYFLLLLHAFAVVVYWPKIIFILPKSTANFNLVDFNATCATILAISCIFRFKLAHIGSFKDALIYRKKIGKGSVA